MPPRRVDWLNGDSVPQQRTVARRMPASAPQPQDHQQSMYSQAPAGAFSAPPQQPQRPAGSFTGAGVDGSVQPNKFAGMVHEGEAVIPANAAQAIPPHLFSAFVDSAAKGTLDLNHLAAAVGQQPMPGYAGGTYSAGTENPNNQVGAIAGTLDFSGGTPSGISASAPQRQSVSSSPVDFYKRANDRIKSSVGLDTTPAEKPPVYNPQVVNAPSFDKPAGALRQAPLAPIQQPVAQQQTVSSVTPSAATKLQQQPTVGTIQDRTGYHPVLSVDGTQEWVKDEAPATETPAETTTTTPTASPTGTLATDNVRRGMQLTAQQMEGMSDSDKRIMNNALLNMDATAAAQIQAQASRISSDPNLSDAGKRTAIAALYRDASSNRSNTVGTLSVAAAERAGTAAQNAISTGQQVRTYEDVTLPQAQQNLQQGDITMKDSLSNQINDRINMLMTQTGATADTIKSDPVLQKLVGQYYGEGATPEAIAGEVGNRVTAWRENSLPNFYSNSSALFEEFQGQGYDEAAVASNARVKDLYRNILTGELGRQPTDAEIDAKIKGEWADYNKNDVDVQVESMVESGYLDDFVTYDAKTGKMTEKVPGIINDLKAVVKDLALQGVAIDPDTGLPEDGAVFDWPWDDPKTYFKYNDWNGGEVTSGMSLGIDPVKKADGTLYTDSNGMPVTNAAATSKWNEMWKLNSTEMEGLFDENGKIDTERAMKFLFPTATREDGSPVSFMTADEFLTNMTENEDYAKNVDNQIELYSDMSKVSKDFADSDEAYMGMEGLSFAEAFPGQFKYYDENGQLQVKDKFTGELAYIHYQLSEKYNKGEPLTAARFNDYWKNGEGWTVAEDGTITNIDNRGVNVNLDKAVSSVKISDGKVAVDATGKPTATIPADQAKTLSINWDKVPATMKASGDPGKLESMDALDYRGNRWQLTGEASNWMAANAGKIYKANNGRLYIVSGQSHDPAGEWNSSMAIILYDYVTGEKVLYSGDAGGGGAERKITGDSYA